MHSMCSHSTADSFLGLVVVGWGAACSPKAIFPGGTVQLLPHTCALADGRLMAGIWVLRCHLGSHQATQGCRKGLVTCN